MIKKKRSSKSFVNIGKRKRSYLVVVEAGRLEMEAMADIALLGFVWFSKALKPSDIRG